MERTIYWPENRFRIQLSFRNAYEQRTANRLSKCDFPWNTYHQRHHLSKQCTLRHLWRVLWNGKRWKIFYNKLTFIYLELPKFTKTEHELETLFEKWVFVLKNLSRLLERPAALQERVFNRLFEAASITRFTPKQLREYEDSVKAYRDSPKPKGNGAWYARYPEGYRLDTWRNPEVINNFLIN